MAELVPRPAVFLDRDGTINKDLGYVYKVEDFVFEIGAIEGLRLLSALPLLRIVMTNQSAIGCGRYTEEDYMAVTSHMHAELAKECLAVDAVYFCPHSPDSHCLCRKPSLGLVHQACREFATRGTEIDLHRSFVVGDKTSDGELGNRVGCRSILCMAPSGNKGADGAFNCTWDYRADDLYMAAQWIAGQGIAGQGIAGQGIAEGMD